MLGDFFQPPVVNAPSKNWFRFSLRMIFDLQLLTIYRPFTKLLRELPEGNLLDLGAGNSPWCEFLPQNVNYMGVDIYNASDFGMKKEGSQIIFYDGKVLPFDANYFESCICIEVLEHVENVDLFMSELSRVLKKDAKLIMTIPWSARRHHTPNDYQRFSREKILLLLNKYEFKNIKILDRGNEICVIFNKILVLFIMCVKTISIKNFFIRILAAISLIPLIIIFNVASHISLLVQRKESESFDPLGYLCIADKL